MTKANTKVSGGYKNWSWGKQIQKVHSSVRGGKNNMTKITRLKAKETHTTVTTNNVTYNWNLKLIPIILLAFVFYYFNLDFFFSIVFALLFSIIFTLRKQN